jgi:hypothetical protein
MTVVTFDRDLYPYTFGDTVNLTDEQLKAVDEDAKRHGIDKPYRKGTSEPDRSKIVTPTGDSDTELARNTTPQRNTQLKVAQVEDKASPLAQAAEAGRADPSAVEPGSGSKQSEDNATTGKEPKSKK